eukprot:3894556-Prymnesium_polylepis.2
MAACLHHQRVRASDRAARAEKSEARHPVADEERNKDRHHAKYEARNREEEVDEIEQAVYVVGVDDVRHRAYREACHQRRLDTDRLVAREHVVELPLPH